MSGERNDTLRDTLRLLASDFETVMTKFAGGRPAGRLRRWSHAILPSTTGVAAFRIAHWLHGRGWFRGATLVSLVGRVVTGLSIHPGSRIGPGLFVPHTSGAFFCGTAGARLELYPQSWVGPARPLGWRDGAGPESPVLGAGVQVGTKSVVQGALVIGDGAKVGSYTVVTGDLRAGGFAIAPRRSRIVPASPD